MNKEEKTHFAHGVAKQRPEDQTLLPGASLERTSLEQQRHRSIPRAPNPWLARNAPTKKAAGTGLKWARFTVPHKTMSILAQSVIENSISSYGQKITTKAKP
jgi:hypothetical protein